MVDKSRENCEQQMFNEDYYKENRSEDGNEDWDGTGSERRLFREIAFENQDINSLGIPEQVSEGQGALRGKKDGSVKKGSDSDEDRNDLDNFDSSDEDDEIYGPPSSVSNKPADILDNDILGLHPPQVIVSSWSANEISHLSQVVPRIGYTSPSPGGFPSFREGYLSFGEELFSR